MSKTFLWSNRPSSIPKPGDIWSRDGEVYIMMRAVAVDQGIDYRQAPSVERIICLGRATEVRWLRDEAKLIEGCGILVAKGHLDSFDVRWGVRLSPYLKSAGIYWCGTSTLPGVTTRYFFCSPTYSLNSIVAKLI